MLNLNFQGIYDRCLYSTILACRSLKSVPAMRTILEKLLEGQLTVVLGPGVCVSLFDVLYDLNQKKVFIIPTELKASTWFGERLLGFPESVLRRRKNMYEVYQVALRALALISTTPALLGARYHHILALIALLRMECSWYYAHRTQLLPTGGSKAMKRVRLPARLTFDPILGRTCLTEP